MKKGWTTKKLIDVILDIKDGGTPSRKNPEYFGGDVYWCVVKDIKPLIYDTAEKLTKDGLNNCSAKVWPVDSVIISLGATIGQIGIAKVPTATKQGLAGIVLNRQIMTPEFLAYGLLGQKEYIQSLATGATIKEIRPTRFAETIQLPVPPLAEQQRIVSLLDEAFENLASAKSNAEKNLQNARALFESHLQSVFTQRGPEWVEKRLGEVCVVKDGTHDSPKYVTDGIPFVTQKNIREDGISFENTKFISQEDHDDFYRRSNATHGDILISMIGANRGMACIVDDERTFSIKNVGLVKQNPSINREFLLYYLKSPQAASFVKGASKGGAQEFVGLTELRRFPVPLPSLERQNTFAETFQSLREETQRLARLYERKHAALEALKKSLLHQAFTGTL